jgi:AraC family transcriptional regulator
MKSATLKFYKERLLRVLIYIQQQLDEPLTLKVLAAQAHLSPYHFHRIFTGMIGESLHLHIRRLRLERSAMQLKYSQKSVIQIALEAGYETHEAFSRAFRNAFHLSPSQFRKQNRSLQIYSRSGIHYHPDHLLKNFKTKPLQKGIQMKVTLKTIQPLHVAFIRHTGPYSECGAAWDRFLTLFGKEGLIDSKTQFIGLCHDDPEITPSDKIRYDACLTVDSHFKPEGDIGMQTISGGDYAVLTHFGPYAKLNESYKKLIGEWIPRSGRELRSSPCFEIYLNSPENTAPEDLITDIYAPLA